MSDRAELAELLGAKTAILLDFDGPVCSIFANHPAPGVADTLREVLADLGVAYPAEVATVQDPLEVLKWTATVGKPSVLKEIETKLREEEVKAAKTSAPTPFGREVIVGAFEAGKAVAIVSNNSAEAIGVYLARQRLTRYGMPVIGRAFARPDLMKPNLEPILATAKSVNVSPSDCVLIGDSLTDIEGAFAAGMDVIGYANRPEKEGRFAEARATWVTTSMAAVATALVDLRL